MYKPNAKYSRQQESMFRFETLDALVEYPGEYLTIEGIKAERGFALGGVNTQKMGRVLNELVAMGLVKKKKEGTHMTYMALATKGDDGEVHTPFETEDSAYGNYFVPTREEDQSPIEINWALDTEVKY